MVFVPQYPTNAPQPLNIDEFRAKLFEYGEVAKSCRFLVVITPTQTAGLPNIIQATYGSISGITYVCDAAEFPGRGFSTNDVRYYGPPMTLPNNSMYSPTILSFICRQYSAERELFDTWLNAINPINTFNFSYPVQYYCDIDIYEYSENARQDGKHQAIYGWRLKKAWPMLVSPQPVTWADTSDILRLQVTFTYKNWEKI